MFVGSRLTREDLEKKSDAAGVDNDGQDPATVPASSTPTDQKHSPTKEESIRWPQKALALIRASINDVREIILEIKRFVSALREVPETRSTVRRLGETLEKVRTEIQKELDELQEHQRDFDSILLGIRQTATGHTSLLDALSRSINARISAVAATPAPVNAIAVSAHEESPLVRSIYTSIEDAFRGSQDDIRRRQTLYLPDVRSAVSRSGSNIVLDLGCGRGEWLELLKSNGIGAIGVDSNAGQLAEARSRGLATAHGDALEFMAGEPANRYASVTAFHVAEHLPFDVLALWIVAALRILAPGGALIVETPNPANLIVGSSSFHLDPTHNKPLPAELLSLLIRAAGFADPQLRFLHPHENLKDALENGPSNIAYLLFGYQDYALIAIKPKT